MNILDDFKILKVNKRNSFYVEIKLTEEDVDMMMRVRDEKREENELYGIVSIQITIIRVMLCGWRYNWIYLVLLII